ncbi:YlaF family protein [Priestia flexa]|uniref:YlaF family protein n=1 Tax=Priestia TaxID=2800373 RepID=UPI0021FD244A|nr:YlaF family protein [Priestia flexa]MDT2047491.1 YlaF family protein [Priestia flexa]USY56388.1 YlaF family protein [Bacillus sp. 1780r2a1]
MKNIKWVFVLYAMLATFSIMAIGIFIGEGSAIGVIGSLVVLVAIMGFGFTTKKKMREKNQL